MKEPISPVTRTKNEARANYNRLSRWYDWIAGSEAKYRQIGIQMLDIQPGERILEIGFGTGSCLVDIARQVGTQGLACGIDLSDGMAAVADERLKEADLAGRAALTLGDAVELPFVGGNLDGIFMSFTLELFETPEIPLVLGQCQRVLSPGGRLVVVSLIKTAQPKLAERLYEWAHARMPVVVDCRPIEAQAALVAVGFKLSVVIVEKMWGLPVEILVVRK